MTSARSTEVRYEGSIPELYDRHLGPALFEPFARDLAARLPANARQVLEVAAGTGRVTRHLLAALPADGELLATDLNAPMLDVARARVGADARLTWQVEDMTSLTRQDASTDAVVCQFGLMFAPDRPRALAELRRVLRPGGTLLLSTWDHLDRNAGPRIFQELAFAAFPDDPPTFMRVPFSMWQPDELQALARGAGFSAARVDTVAQIGESESAAHLAIGYVRGNPIVHQLIERGFDPDAFEADVARSLAAALGERPCRSPLSAHVLTAIA